MSADIRLNPAEQAILDAQLDKLQQEQDEKDQKAYAKYERDIAMRRRGGDRSLFPKLWQRLKNQIEPSEADELVAPPTKSGANVTLDDLASQ